MNILVIGANGFLGKHLVRRCLSLGWNVECVFRKDEQNIPDTCIRYSSEKIELINTKFDTVFLVAAAVPYTHRNILDDDFIESNIELPLRVRKKFIQSKIVFSSSVSVYGTPRGILNEKSTFNSPGTYGKSKIAGEIIIQSCERYSIVRFSSLYGEGMNQYTFLPFVINSAKKNKEIEILGKGSRLQNYLNVDDAVSYLVTSSLIEKSDIYLGVDKRSYSNEEVALIIKSFLPDTKIIYKGRDASSSFVYNNITTSKKLKYTPNTILKKGIQMLINYE